MKDCTILAHNYVNYDVQMMASFTGDSLELAKAAIAAESDCIVLAGVDFMAEVAAILNPDKVIISPDRASLCAMALRVSPEAILNARKEYPGAAVVTYINSSATVKAVSDIICTSSNAVKVVESLDEEEVIFVPDRNLAAFVAKHTEKKIIPIPVDGCCPVHHAISPADILFQKMRFPESIVIVHPETTPEVQKLADYVGSTSQILRWVNELPDTMMIIGTEIGIIERMQKDHPEKMIVPGARHSFCPDMKMITVEKVQKALKSKSPVVSVPPGVREGAKRALERMLEVS